jgi:DNA-binding CsgD family transcriptional regulator
MNLELFTGTATKIWKQAASESNTELLKVELDIYKQLLNFFQVGDYYYYILNFQTQSLDLISKEVESVLGYTPEEATVEFLMSKVHPDDRAYFLAFEQNTSDFFEKLEPEKKMKYKVRCDFRFQKKNGDYVRLLQQVVVIQADEDGGIFRTLGIHTDITHLKPEGGPTMSIIGLDGEPSYINIGNKNVYIETEEVLSKREKEVLRLLIEGKLSKEICSILNISKQTVDNHRKNMLNKTGLKTTGELIGKAIKNGWI